jgi:hypothetical protein
MGHKKYPPNLLYVRAAYKTAFSIFVNAVNEMQAGEGIHLALGGTSGVGKTFFFRYVIWRLLHPADMEGFPQTILLCPDPKGVNGYLYHAGKFYSVMSVSDLLVSDVGKNLFNHKNAWIISDGKPAPDEMDCPTLVISSPGNFQHDDVNGTKAYFKNADCKAFLPPWTEVEIWAVAHHVFNLGPGDEDTLKTRFERYGGVPRAIFNKFREALKPLTSAFALTNVTDSLNSVGEDINHQFISGTILHLIPSKTLQEPVRYEWASTAMMEGAFGMMFKLTRHKTECFVHGAMGLHLGTFYGLLFEPYFHSRVTTQGYTGRMRQLSRKAYTETKRVWYGGKKKESEAFEHTIPILQINHFHYHRDIVVSKYNVPDRKNFAAVDSVSPSLGEMYQVTSAESHPIKAIHLAPLKKFFKSTLDKGELVKLIFIVPPNRFDDFDTQKYLFTVPKKSKKKDGDENVDVEESKKGKMEEENENKEGEESKKGKKKEEENDVDGEEEDENPERLAEVAWIEQYVLEVNAKPLTRIFDKRIEDEVSPGLAARLLPGRRNPNQGIT